jgi:hypothetical protein
MDLPTKTAPAKAVEEASQIRSLSPHREILVGGSLLHSQTRTDCGGHGGGVRGAIRSRKPDSAKPQVRPLIASIDPGCAARA